jgi:hypothetical protein
MNENSADRDPFGLDPDKGEYSWDLDIQLETTIDSYAQSREGYLNKQDDIVSQFMYQQAEKFAEIILRDTEQLFPFEDFDKDLQKLKCQLNETYSNKPILEKYSSILSSGKSSEEK